MPTLTPPTQRRTCPRCQSSTPGSARWHCGHTAALPNYSCSARSWSCQQSHTKCCYRLASALHAERLQMCPYWGCEDRLLFPWLAGTKSWEHTTSTAERQLGCLPCRAPGCHTELRVDKNLSLSHGGLTQIPAVPAGK